MATKTIAADTNASEDTANRIRELNENLIRLAKETGQSSPDTYEKALQSLVDFEKSVASRSQVAWVTGRANTHAKFVQDLTGFYIKAAREARSNEAAGATPPEGGGSTSAVTTPIIRSPGGGP
jgi:hypothetical protein